MTTVWDFLTVFIRERLADGGAVDWFMLAALAASVPVVAVLVWLFLAPLLPARREVPAEAGVVPVPAVRRRPFGRLTARNEAILREREERQ